MFKNLKLSAKLIMGFMIIVLMAVIGGGVAYWGVSSLSAEAKASRDKMEAARKTAMISFWAVKQYQNQADLVINQSMDSVKAFDTSAAEMDKVNAEVDKIIDSEAEKKANETMDKANADYRKLFKEKVVPEVEYVLKGTVKELDGKSDVLMTQIQEPAQKFAASIQKELDAAIAKNDSEAIKKRSEELLAVEKMLFWLVKQYQNQADLVINQNLKSIDDFQESAKQMDAAKEVVRKAADTPDELQLMAAIDKADEAYGRLFTDEVVPAVKHDMEDRLRKLDAESDPLIAAAIDNANQIVASLAKDADDASKQMDATGTLVRTVVVATAIFTLIAGVILALVLARSITAPLNRAIEALGAGSEQVTSAAGQISSSSQQLAEGATEQASSLEESSSALEELAGQARGNSEKAKRATEGADLAMTTAEKANQAMNETVKTMNDIKESSGKISGIIKTIEEIAFQTNLLALNAAVEAARAGEHGKGFAVVAEEVRNLAQRSAVAAKDTATLIETSVEQSKRGADVVGKASDAIEQILGAARAVAKDAREVTVASNEQSEGIAQINNAVAQMDKVTQQVASNAEESASASEELSAQAQQLQSIVGDLVALVGGSNDNGKSNGNGRVHMQVEHHAAMRAVPARRQVAQLRQQKAISHAAAGSKSKAAEAIPFDDDGNVSDEF